MPIGGNAGAQVEIGRGRRQVRRPVQRGGQHDCRRGGGRHQTRRIDVGDLLVGQRLVEEGKLIHDTQEPPRGAAGVPAQEEVGEAKVLGGVIGRIGVRNQHGIGTHVEGAVGPGHNEGNEGPLAIGRNQAAGGHGGIIPSVGERIARTDAKSGPGAGANARKDESGAG